MTLIARGIAFALAVAPGLAYAGENVPPPKPTSKDAERTGGDPMNTPDTNKPSDTATPASSPCSTM